MHVNHEFEPLLFIHINGQLGNISTQKVIDTYNNLSNKIDVAVASIAVVEGYNFVAVNHVFVMVFPSSVP